MKGRIVNNGNNLKVITRAVCKQSPYFPKVFPFPSRTKSYRRVFSFCSAYKLQMIPKITVLSWSWCNFISGFIYRTHGDIFIDDITAINVSLTSNAQFIQMFVFIAQCLLFAAETLGARIIGAFLLTAFVGIQIHFVVNIPLDESSNLMISCCELMIEN